MSLRGQKARLRSSVPAAQFFVVTLGARSLAFDGDAVRGLLTSEEAGESEVVTVQGVAYANVDLAGRLALSTDEGSSDTLIVLLSWGRLQGSVRVDRVQGRVELDQSQILPLPRQFQGEERTWYRGIILFEESVAPVLDTAWILQGVETGQGGASHERQSRTPHLLPVRRELMMGKVQEC